MTSPVLDPVLPRCRIVMAPNAYTKERPTIFLSGSIDRPTATWQSLLTAALSHLSVTILNPHREDWDSTWREDVDFAPFREQVNWELDAMKAADIVAVYFNPESPAPITLMELGLFAKEKKMVVACPKGYYKRGNVQIVCQKYGIEVVDNVAELAGRVVNLLGEIGAIKDI
ncbi:uncharacterized protein RSE6_11787 [Rhynchosporium secalis]|uniref:Nucleoside 2-deoxyribosyltransferase n=1 Tax=Rhynchosporium secalis TaxID=38038 RepID=A0A1E1MPS0_RHYSE|nr:uncharacterized protein RSE6_11787 [Rhynchosporium secalis]